MKLLIVEDEKLPRETLAEMPWSDIGIELIGQAAGTNEALKIARTNPPDIVITDIAMDDGNGFYLAEELSYLIPTCKIIFLTAYDKFEYAHKAIKYKAFAFILKPINRKEIMQTVEQAKTELTKMNDKQKQYQLMLSNFSDCKYFLKEFFYSLIKNHPEQIEQYFEIGTENSKYQALIVTQYNNKISTLDFKLFWNIHILLKQSEYSNVLPFYDNDMLTFIFWYDKTCENSFNYIFDAATIIDNHMSYACTDSSYTISIGSIAETKEMIPYSIQRAEDALKYNFSLGENQILYIDDLEPLNNNIHNLNEISDGIINNIKTGNLSEATSFVSKLFHNLRKSTTSSDFAQRICFELIVSFSIALGQLGYNPEIIFQKTDIWSVLKKCQSLHELEELILGITHTTCTIINTSRENKDKDIIDQVIEKLENDDTRDISLLEMAKQIYISPCYLSSMFKQKTGMSYKSFVIQVKIKKAKKLLEQTEIPIHKIASAIGYKSPQHFSTVFREHTGLLPTEYRNMKHESK